MREYRSPVNRPPTGDGTGRKVSPYGVGASVRDVYQDRLVRQLNGAIGHFGYRDLRFTQLVNDLISRTPIPLASSASQ
jgi:hypothetical protein